MWGLFMGFYNAAQNTLTAGQSLVMNINYPREALLVKQIAEQLATFTITLAVSLFVLMVFGIWPAWQTVFLPFVCAKPWTQVRSAVQLLDLVSGMPFTTADCEVPAMTADGVLRCTLYDVPFLPCSYAVMFSISHGNIVLDAWRYAAQVTARRMSPKPSNKVKKFPHEITIDTGDASYHHTYELPADDEASVRIT